MPRKEKSPKKKTPKKTRRDFEDPAMQEADINRFLQNALDQANARHEEQLKELEEKLTKKFDDEMIEMQDAFEQTKGEKPSMKDTHVFREAVITAVQAAHHQNYTDKKPDIPKRFLDLLKKYEYSPSRRSRRGDAQLNLLCSHLTEMQIGP